MSSRHDNTFWDRYNQMSHLPDHERIQEWVLRWAHTEDLAYRPDEHGFWRNENELANTAMSLYDQLSPPAQARLYAANPILMEHGKPTPEVLPGKYSRMFARLGPSPKWECVLACPPRSYASPSGTRVEMQRGAALAALSSE